MSNYAANLQICWRPLTRWREAEQRVRASCNATQHQLLAWAGGHQRRTVVGKAYAGIGEYRGRRRRRLVAHHALLAAGHREQPPACPAAAQQYSGRLARLDGHNEGCWCRRVTAQGTAPQVTSCRQTGGQVKPDTTCRSPLLRQAVFCVCVACLMHDESYEQGLTRRLCRLVPLKRRCLCASTRPGP
jgi:hypothetical protein